MRIVKNMPLSPLSSFGCGGAAEKYATITSPEDLTKLLPELEQASQIWSLGEGTNVLISDQGLPGLCLHFKTQEIVLKEQILIADSGCNWDRLVAYAIKNNLWGIELMSGIPGSCGGAAAININAYGQSLSDRLLWVEIYNFKTRKKQLVDFKSEDWGYKKSPFANRSCLILKIALKLSSESNSELKYAAAIAYAKNQNLNPKDLNARRQIILGTRAKAGSLLNEAKGNQAKTCGSFFRNPIVSKKQAALVLKYEESGLQSSQIRAMNRLHGGNDCRVSAAHVLLAAGYKRGQIFGRVRLHPNHVLKIENYANATANEIYETALKICENVKRRLNINLDFEVDLLGKF